MAGNRHFSLCMAPIVTMLKMLHGAAPAADEEDLKQILAMLPSDVYDKVTGSGVKRPMDYKVACRVLALVHDRLLQGSRHAVSKSKSPGRVFAGKQSKNISRWQQACRFARQQTGLKGVVKKNTKLHEVAMKYMLFLS
eukprot:CAMPEP_0197637672 /NCGR_PEP_ID=MMETSP1338-20131121/12824_1 /TAXON_ID=43686 ORGANISM="Pelagodinium beii, Strain RCC1491" /NCGR_SAMPLE_ID=MMETSP1338 /ASSEMBLY_ACC=CAM_ASM_000754 /LENGTH=137 /DNA_ID=CAMNT_0043210121 /DNA_START=37 /DNA_END=450 /DNA_ORIENTATION=-